MPPLPLSLSSSSPPLPPPNATITSISSPTSSTTTHRHPKGACGLDNHQRGRVGSGSAQKGAFGLCDASWVRSAWSGSNHHEGGFGLGLAAAPEGGCVWVASAGGMVCKLLSPKRVRFDYGFMTPQGCVGLGAATTLRWVWVAATQQGVFRSVIVHRTNKGIGCVEFGCGIAGVCRVCLRKHEYVYEEDIKLLKREIYLRDLNIKELKRKLELVTKEKDEVQLTVQNFENSLKSLSELLDKQIMDKCKTELGYNVVPPPYTGNFMPPKHDLVYPSLDDFVDVIESTSESVVKKPTIETNEPKTARKEDGA
ncbi:hypothetical protein Tco_1555256 [Tanacetum coccineum]